MNVTTTDEFTLARFRESIAVHRERIVPATITLEITHGKMAGQKFVYDERDSCLIGRHKECLVRVRDEVDRTVSRRHCLLDINPPDIRIRDYGSRNGTFINGKKIGQRKKGQTPEEGAQFAESEFSDHDLHHGDRLKLGRNTVVEVTVYVPAVCADCEQEIADNLREPAKVAPELFRCAACREKAQADRRRAAPEPKPQRCPKCGRDVSEEVGKGRHGDLICASCQANPLQILLRMLDLAKSGQQDLADVRGYTIERTPSGQPIRLGKGGMGAVYLARSDRTGERVALKVMLPQVAVDRHGKENFLREMENTKALSHHNVVALHEAVCSDATFFFTMEFCEAGSVDGLMAKHGGKLSIDQAAPLVLDVLDGLHYAHHADIPRVKLKDGRYGSGKGLVHRDLSPQNIFLTQSGRTLIGKVGDYGLSKAFDTAGLSGQTRTGTAAGKPVFMPRQQAIDFKHSKPEVDVWAAAASLYNMLTGNFPRDFRPGRDPWMTILQTRPIPIRKRDPSIPKPLAEVIDRALTDAPKIGFRSAADLRRALEGAL